MLQVYNLGVDPQFSFGRLVKEEEDESLLFLRDREKVIFSHAFKRLQYKTQVFVNHEGDHHRNRLTHSLEVAAIAKNIARKLKINEDLTEVIALAHDLGHPPFGHAGEDGLKDVMKDFGGFDHNFHTLKIIALLEKHDSDHGLNLSYEAIEGLIKHNGPIKDKIKALRYKELFKGMDFKLDLQPTVEAQVASLADDIAYCAHDIEDGIRSEFFDIRCMMNIDIIKRASADGAEKYLDVIINNIRNIMIADVVSATIKNFSKYGITTSDQVLYHHNGVVGFSEEISRDKDSIKDFLMIAVYRNYKINRMREKGQALIRDLFNKFMAVPDCLPTIWNKKILNDDMQSKASVISDYIAGMTDRNTKECLNYDLLKYY